MAGPDNDPPIDSRLVTAINRVYYENEAGAYDHDHPEVLKGDAQWWGRVGRQALVEARAAERMRILDVGSGTGLVLDSLADHLGPNDLICSIELSPSMLAQTRAKWVGRPLTFRAEFINGEATRLPFADASLDMVTMNALLHHLYDPQGLMREVDRALKPGGLVFMSHEPNRCFFESPLLRGLSFLYKVVGGGIKPPAAETCRAINAALRQQGLIKKDLSDARIHRLVEFHSPVERHRYAVSADAGFDPQEIAERGFPRYEVVERQEFTTFFYRPLFEKVPWVSRFLEAVWQLFLRHGNHFRLALQKPGPLPTSAPATAPATAPAFD